MDIDKRDIEKGPLQEILPNFYPNSISHLSELNEYRLYAEMWSNDRNRANNGKEKRKQIGHEGYLKTLEMGELIKKRKIDRVRFESFVVADSVNYTAKWGDPHANVQMGGIQTNPAFNEIIRENSHLFEIQSRYPGTDFHSEDYLPKTVDIDLEALDLKKDEETNKFYFEIPTNLGEIQNKFQKMVLLKVLGEDVFSEKLELLYKIKRTHIRCLFEDPEYVWKKKNISRLCVVWPFHEKIVVDFAGTFEDCEDVCLLGKLIEEEILFEEGTAKIPGNNEEMFSLASQIDSYV